MIADEVIARFKSGLDLDDEIRHFLKSGEGLSDDEDVSSFFVNRDCDSSPVYELIFFPDHEMRLKVENLIPAKGLRRVEVNNIISIVETEGTDIIINTGSQRVALQWDRFACNAVEYIKKLNLDVDVDVFPRKNGVDFQEERIVLRRGRIPCCGETADFFGTLAVQARARILPGCTELFSFALQVLGGKNEKLLEHLENKKCFYETAVRDSAEFAGILGRYSMEYVMAKKIPVPLISADEALEAIRKIDLITSLVYGLIIPPVDHGVDILLKEGRLSEK